MAFDDPTALEAETELLRQATMALYGPNVALHPKAMERVRQDYRMRMAGTINASDQARAR